MIDSVLRRDTAFTVARMDAEFARETLAQEEGVKAIHAIHSAFGLAGNQKIQIPA